MASVYSTRFFTEQGLGGTGASVIVPTGHVYVVRYVTWYASVGLAPLVAFLEDDATNAALANATWQPGEAASKNFDCRIVFLAGTGFHVQVNPTVGFTDKADVSISGYDLTA